MKKPAWHWHGSDPDAHDTVFDMFGEPDVIEVQDGSAGVSDAEKSSAPTAPDRGQRIIQVVCVLTMLGAVAVFATAQWMAWSPRVDAAAQAQVDQAVAQQRQAEDARDAQLLAVQDQLPGVDAASLNFETAAGERLISDITTVLGSRTDSATTVSVIAQQYPALSSDAQLLRSVIPDLIQATSTSAVLGETPVRYQVVDVQALPMTEATSGSDRTYVAQAALVGLVPSGEQEPDGQYLVLHYTVNAQHEIVDVQGALADPDSAQRLTEDAQSSLHDRLTR